MRPKYPSSGLVADLDPTCDFCKILMGTEEAQVVCETESALAFFPLEPAALGHTLVIPKQHVPDLWSADDTIATLVTQAAVRVGRAIKDALEPDGMNLISSAGAAASQTVFHLHLHVVPRWNRDHIGPIWPPSQPWSETVKHDIADRVRRACDYVQ